MKFRAKSCKIVQNRAKIMQNRAAKVKMIQKRASQGFLDPIQKRALSRSVQLEAVYLEALLYIKKMCISRSHLPKNVQKRAKNMHLKCFWTLFKNVHCQGPCSLRPCISSRVATYVAVHKSLLTQ